MKKVLVPTDFSGNSKAGFRFALQWSTMQQLHLIFVHVLHLVRLPYWTNDNFSKYLEQEKKTYKEKLEEFVARTCKSIRIEPTKYSCIVIEGASPDLAILDYCRQNTGIDYICISTRGASKLKKIFGTNTGNLITKSDVPVIAIPKAYKIRPIEHILYSTDLLNCTNELKKVISFARPVKATVEVLHFTWPGEVLPDKKLFKPTFKKKVNYPLTLHFEKTDITESLVKRLQGHIRLSHPSVVIMFTEQKRSLFQRIFLSSKAEQLSFQSKVPLLVFKKS